MTDQGLKSLAQGPPTEETKPSSAPGCQGRTEPGFVSTGIQPSVVAQRGAESRRPHRAVGSTVFVRLNRRGADGARNPLNMNNGGQRRDRDSWHRLCPPPTIKAPRLCEGERDCAPEPSYQVETSFTHNYTIPQKPAAVKEKKSVHPKTAQIRSPLTTYRPAAQVTPPPNKPLRRSRQAKPSPSDSLRRPSQRQSFQSAAHLTSRRSAEHYTSRHYADQTSPRRGTPNRRPSQNKSSHGSPNRRPDRPGPEHNADQCNPTHFSPLRRPTPKNARMTHTEAHMSHPGPNQG